MRARTGVGRAAPEGPQPRRKGHSMTPADRGRHAHPGGGRAPAPGREEAGAEGFVAVVGRAGGDGAGPRSHLALLRKTLHLSTPSASSSRVWMDGPSGSSPRAGRPLDLAVVAAYTQLRLARERVADLRLPWERRYDVGRLTPVRVHRAVSSLSVRWHASEGAETLRKISREAQRPPLGRAKRYPAIKKAA